VRIFIGAVRSLEYYGDGLDLSSTQADRAVLQA